MEYQKAWSCKKILYLTTTSSKEGWIKYKSYGVLALIV
jgi:intracellular septation protein A